MVKISVTNGSIHVNSVKVMASSNSSMWFSVDCRAKYAEVAMVIANDNDLEIYLSYGEETLDANRDEAPTYISITGLPGNDWLCLTDVGRYNINIVCMRKKGQVNRLEIKDWYDKRGANTSQEAGYNG